LALGCVDFCPGEAFNIPALKAVEVFGKVGYGVIAADAFFVKVRKAVFNVRACAGKFPLRTFQGVLFYPVNCCLHAFVRFAYGYALFPEIVYDFGMPVLCGALGLFYYPVCHLRFHLLKLPDE